MKRNKWDERYVMLAELVASWSKDPSTRCGAVIVDHERRIVSVGYNGFPRFVNDDPERYAERMVKYKLIVHAEANAIVSPQRSVAGCGMWTTKFPCSECAKLICQAGISVVTAPMRDPSVSDPSVLRWKEDAEFAFTMMNEAGVTIREYEP